MKGFSLWKLVFSILVCEAAGILGSLFTISAIPTWYAILNKPTFSPPNWIFAPVWTILYLMMGISLYLVWQKGIKTKGVKNALSVFGLQLALNASWSIVFFTGQSIVGGLLIIVILWSLILITILKFLKISQTAALLLVPYLLWVSFATILNFYIFKLN